MQNPDEVGKWVSELQRTMGGRRDGCCGSVQRAQWVFEARGGPWGWYLGSAEHAGVGLGWQTGKLTFTYWTCSIDLIFINELDEISGMHRGAGPCRHRPVSLNSANKAAPGGWTAAGTTRTSMGSQKCCGEVEGCACGLTASQLHTTHSLCSWDEW